MNNIPTSSTLQILVVDDEENILRSLKRLLTNEDFDVLTAISGNEALQILKNNNEIALIISDQRMPGLSGVEFLQETIKLAPDATRIILTGYADVNAAIDGINKGGAYRYITKPWNDNELLQIVNEAVLKFVLIKDNERLTLLTKKQNDDLNKLNSSLNSLVQQQTVEITEQNEELIKLNKNLKNNYKNTIMAFSNLLEMRDISSGNHSRNVAELSMKIAKQLDMSEEDIQRIMVTALLHDIGKIGIPDYLITKETEDMSTDEKNVYLQHTVRGQSAIDLIEDMRDIGTMIRHHHEWYNGGGYPDGLTGTRIPVGSRIISLADYVDRTIRKFKGSEAINNTLTLVKKEIGRKFDNNLYPLIESPMKAVYAELLQKSDMVIKEVHTKELMPGMVLAKDVRSGTGLLILRKGNLLNDNNIRCLHRSYGIDPSRRTGETDQFDP